MPRLPLCPPNFPCQPCCHGTLLLRGHGSLPCPRPRRGSSRQSEASQGQTQADAADFMLRRGAQLRRHVSYLLRADPLVGVEAVGGPARRLATAHDSTVAISDVDGAYPGRLPLPPPLLLASPRARCRFAECVQLSMGISAIASAFALSMHAHSMVRELMHSTRRSILTPPPSPLHPPPSTHHPRPTTLDPPPSPDVRLTAGPRVRCHRHHLHDGSDLRHSRLRVH